MWIAVLLATLSAALLAVSCAPGVYEGGIDDGSTGARVAGLVRIRESGDRMAIPKVVECLASNDPVVRQEAYRCIQALTGRTLDYRPDDPPLERQAAVNRWVEWCRAEGLVPGATQS